MPEKFKDPTRVITGKVRFAYPQVWEAKAFEGGKPKYSVRLLIPKEDTATVKKINEAIKAAYENGKKILQGDSETPRPLSSIKNPLRDGDMEFPDNTAYEGCYFLNANSMYAPGIVDDDRQPITDHDEIYSGVYGRASISFYAYNSAGNMGIACSLNNLQKLEDGERLGGGASAAEDFADDDDEEEFIPG